MVETFIKRPVLSVVISLIITFLGIISMLRLPVTQYPSIAPPEVNVTVEYTGTNAETVTKAAIIPLERAINGVPKMKYITSLAGNDGVGLIKIFFEVGTDPDIASVNVQNRIGSVMGELPPEVVKNGIKVNKAENAMLMYLDIFSEDSTLEEKFIYNFADINILPELKKINGVGFANILGAKEYAMRIWLKPDKMLSYKVSSEDVLEALVNQNVEAAPGKIGENSDKLSNALQYVVTYSGKFNTIEQYENIPVKATFNGEMLRIKDIADVEFGTTYFDVETKLDGKHSAAIVLKQLPGSNANETIQRIKTRMKEIKRDMFLKGMDYKISYDVSGFLKASTHEVIKTLIEAFILVSLVVFVFLQDFRSTIIPAITVPVSLVGTFFFMEWMGFSINLITLFSMVLAIGIVIDDAIVVVEAIHHKMETEKIDPLSAAKSAMKEISGAIVSITLVMSAVFVPTAFMTGPMGIFYKQFSLTLAVSIVLSGIGALTLTPALSSLFIKPASKKQMAFLLVFYQWFNAAYDKLSNKYLLLLKKVINYRYWCIGFLAITIGCTYLISTRLAAGFIPNEDQSTFYINVSTPTGSTLERTKWVVDQILAQCKSFPSISSVSAMAGSNVLSDGTGATYGACLVNLKPWTERKESVEEVMEQVKIATQGLKDAQLDFFPPPPVPGYGNASGFELRLLDKTGSGDYQKMQSVVKDFLKKIQGHDKIKGAFTIFDASFPQYLVEIDMDKAAQKGVHVADAMGALQTFLGSEYATNFLKFGKTYKVMVQSLPEYRKVPEDIPKLFVENNLGEMVQLSTFISLKKTYGFDQITRYNLFPSAEITGEPKSGYSSGDAINAINALAIDYLPKGYGIDWAGITLDEVLAGNQALYIFIVCLLFVYLILSAQYESFLIPFSVVLGLPTGIFGAVAFLWVFGLENNIYAQSAMIMLIGLLGKNAILIVEYALHNESKGLTSAESVLLACQDRLRPILMTSFAFIAGMLPLMFADGAGAVANRTIGTAAAGGMLFGTGLGLFIVPCLYLIVSRKKENSSKIIIENEL